MGFLLLLLGLALWIGAHLFKRVAPERRAALGDRGKGLVAAAIGLSLVLMVLGYRSAEFVNVWYPAAWLTHVNNVLMLFAFYSFGIGASKGRHAQRIRHPQLTAVKIWAVAHLLANGDLASILLFGGLLGWAVAEVVLINKAVPVWEKPSEIRPNGDVKNAIIAAVLYAVVAGIHVLLGVYPFG
ncbi:hypothetical protein DKT77_17590 [Meridianimarinicoccus roseus]|jgi:uncharacterized membrane protein|uniref:NnrU domain-containing protein n=1 Tax=Meridianimarinicoccus roseus TaxID=2072018 RepID=A0A2V2LDK2_9RHOB|nr:NnrU family protein [Meridianimarinicoccus roseus]PWR01376.1 hypothetical protein DKT77_17590 [Meridianimarinicoccus roseus]